MKTTITFLLFLVSFSSFSQVYGDIFLDKRKVDQKIEFTINYSKPGKLIFDIAVNPDGKITSCTLNKSKSTIQSTSAVMKAKNKIMQHLHFEKGSKWPKFHRGFIQINTVQGSEEKDSKFSPPAN
jgi:hypothetical protein